MCTDKIPLIELLENVILLSSHSKNIDMATRFKKNIYILTPALCAHNRGDCFRTVCLKEWTIRFTEFM